MPNPDLDALLEKCAQFKSDLAVISDMRPGSLNPGFGKCNKPPCQCVKDGDPSHGSSCFCTDPRKG